MKHRRFLHGAKFWVWVLLLGTYSAGAVGVLLVDAWEERYRSLSRVKLTSVQSDPDQRRAQSGTPFSTLPSGSSLQIIWPDGSTETVMIIDPAAALGAEPVEGSQLSAAEVAGP